MRIHRRATLVVLAALMSGCAGVKMTQVSQGEVIVRERLSVTVDRPWNRFEGTPGDATPVWTQHGVSVDALRFYVGLKNGDLIAPTPSSPPGVPALAFRSNMHASDIVSLFEGLYSRGGSTFALDKVEPTTFAGQNGFRFDFSGIRKSDDVRLQGIAWGALRNGELFLISYTAPRLAFFQRGVNDAEAVSRSARIR
jgi:hypothetical protein